MMRSLVPLVTFLALTWLAAFDQADRVTPTPKPDDDHCSSLVLDNRGQVLFACNYDRQKDDDGLVLINKRGLSKRGSHPGSFGGYAEWVSRYTSVTFSLLGYQYAWSGMNEKGLSFSTMALEETQSPPRDERPLLDHGMWLQYMLDTCETVDEAIGIDQAVRISTVDHYLVADRYGGVAVIEFLGGRQVAHTGPDLCAKALTNSAYEEACSVWRSLGGTSPYSHPDGSIQRFCLAARKANDFRPGSTARAVQQAFATLHEIRIQGHTRWSIVFDTRNLRAYFKTQRNPEIRWVDLEAFDPRCGRQPQMLDVNSELTGDVTKAFSDLDYDLNREFFKNYLIRWRIPYSQNYIDSQTSRFEHYPCQVTRRATRRLAPIGARH